MRKDLFDEVSDITFGIIDEAKLNSKYKMLLVRTHVDLMNNSELLQQWIELTCYNPDPWTIPKTLISSFPTKNPEEILLAKISEKI